MSGPLLADALRKARTMLREAGVESDGLDARLLLEAVVGLTPSERIAAASRRLSVAEDARLAALLRRRIAGEPVARILGEWEFYGLTLKLNAACLIPRPETELLVDLALSAPLPPDARVLDLGTGPGTILLALLANRPLWRGEGVDCSLEALTMARSNAERLGVERAAFHAGSWFEPVSGRFDLIVSNPPYIPSDECADLQREVREHDPRRALDGGADGLDAYRVIAAQAGALLASGGRVLVEIGIGQGDAVAGLFAAAGFSNVGRHRDLAGIERVLVAF